MLPMQMQSYYNTAGSVGSSIWGGAVPGCGCPQCQGRSIGYPWQSTPNPVPKNLPVRQQSDPWIGYKTLKMVVDEGRLRFRGQTGAVYDLESTAKCAAMNSVWAYTNAIYSSQQIRYTYGVDGTITAHLDPPIPEQSSQELHRSPDPDCSCGFYALADRPKDWEYGAFLAQVELYGRTVRGELGWRVECQRVLQIEAKKTCVVNGHGTDAVGFSTGADGTIIAVCKDHGALNYATPSELTGKIGTEVRWSA